MVMSISHAYVPSITLSVSQHLGKIIQFLTCQYNSAYEPMNRMEDYVHSLYS